MVPVKFKGILCLSSCSLRATLMWYSVFKPPSIVYSIGSRSVTLWVSIPLSKRALLLCSAVLVATVKLLAGSGVYPYLYAVLFYALFSCSLCLLLNKVVRVNV